MVLFELVFYSLNESIGVIEYVSLLSVYLLVGLLACRELQLRLLTHHCRFQAVDMGGSIFVHTFGAYFGLGVAKLLGNTDHDNKVYRKNLFNSSSRLSDLFAMIGTLFLFLFWPSFNGALASGAAQHRVIINTVISLAFSAVSAFAFSQLFRPSRKFNMIDIQNATLAGGVAVGSSADLIIEPWGAAIIGLLAGRPGHFELVGTPSMLLVKGW